MSKYAKFWVAAASALVVAVSTSADGEFSLNDWMSILSAGVGAVAVAMVPNKAD